MLPRISFKWGFCFCLVRCLSTHLVHFSLLLFCAVTLPGKLYADKDASMHMMSVLPSHQAKDSNVSTDIDSCECVGGGPSGDGHHTRWGDTCYNHDNDPAGAWCWVRSDCNRAVKTWWNERFAYCAESRPRAHTNDLPAQQLLLDENWQLGLRRDEWEVVDEGDHLYPSDWVVREYYQGVSHVYAGSQLERKQVLIQRSDILSLEPRSELPKKGTFMWYRRGLGWGDYDFSVSLASTDNDILGVMFRYVDRNNYYRFSIDRQPDRFTRRLVKCVEGNFTLLAFDHQRYQPNHFYLVSISLSGEKVEVLVDGSRLFELKDESHLTGSIALYSWGNREAHFDRVLVLDPSALALRKLVHRMHGVAEPFQRMTTKRVQQPSWEMLEMIESDGDPNAFPPFTPPTKRWAIGDTVALIVALCAVSGLLAATVIMISPSVSKNEKERQSGGDIQVSGLSLNAFFNQQHPAAQGPCESTRLKSADDDGRDGQERTSYTPLHPVRPAGSKAETVNIAPAVASAAFPQTVSCVGMNVSQNHRRRNMPIDGKVVMGFAGTYCQSEIFGDEKYDNMDTDCRTTLSYQCAGLQLSDPTGESLVVSLKDRHSVPDGLEPLEMLDFLQPLELLAVPGASATS